MKSRPSLFARLRRYETTPGRDPVEDRATEALAATLDAAPAAARRVVERAFPDVPASRTGNVLVSTQEPASGRDRVDLQIFRHGGEYPLRVWLEAKVYSPADPEQGKRYIDELEARKLRDAIPWRFAWLLRAGDDVRGIRPTGAERITWQEVTGWLHEWLHEVGEQDPHSHASTMVREFISYMEEQHLGYSSGLDHDDAIALNRHDRARGTARELIRQARELIAAQWPEADPLVEEVPRDPLGFWRHYANAPTGEPPRWPREHWRFEWHGRNDSARAVERQTGERVLGAGVVIDRAYAPREDDEWPWLSSLYEQGFEYGTSGPQDPYVYLFRYLTLDQIAEHRDLATQADFVATHAVESWRTLHNSPPPFPAPSGPGTPRTG